MDSGSLLHQPPLKHGTCSCCMWAWLLNTACHLWPSLLSCIDIHLQMAATSLHCS